MRLIASCKAAPNPMGMAPKNSSPVPLIRGLTIRPAVPLENTEAVVAALPPLLIACRPLLVMGPGWLLLVNGRPCNPKHCKIQSSVPHHISHVGSPMPTVLLSTTVTLTRPFCTPDPYECNDQA